MHNVVELRHLAWGLKANGPHVPVEEPSMNATIEKQPTQNQVLEEENGDEELVEVGSVSETQGSPIGFQPEPGGGRTFG